MRTNRYWATLVAATLLLTACGGGKDNAAPEMIWRTRADLLGTVISIASYEQLDEAVFDGAFDLVDDIDARMTANSAESEVGQVNAGSGGVVPVSEEVRALVERAGALSMLSDGAFDISIGSVSRLWKRDGAFTVLPDPTEIETRLNLVDFEEIQILEEGIRLAGGMQLDLGAIAKGYACDRALDYLKSQGVDAALLDFGGNIYAHGLKPDGGPWRIGIALPVIGETGSACAVSATDLAVVTSGGYERFFEQDGVTYHHILDPKTGYPADSGLLSVTILDPSATSADALSTACFVLGLEQGQALLERLSDCEGIFITEDCEIYVTSGLMGSVTVLDDRFTLVEDISR